jgi:hypothetical protein
MENALERRPWLVPLLLAMLCVIFFRHVLLPEPGYGGLVSDYYERGDDLRDFFYPALTFVTGAIQNGQLPLWNPYIYGGTPVAANPEFGLFYPPNALMLAVGVVRGVALLLVLHVWWGAWGMAKLAQSMGASALGGMLAGIIFGFSSQFMVRIWAGHFTYALAAAWGPWVLAAYNHALKRRTWRAALPGVAALALALLAGHPPVVFYIAMLLIGLWLYHIIGVTADGEPVRPVLWLATRQLLIVAVGSTALSAIQLIPTIEFIPFSTRSGGLLPQFVDSFSLPGAQLLTIVLPKLLGDPTIDVGYWGGSNFEELSGGFAGLWAVLAAFLALRLKKREAYFYWAVALVGLVLSLGFSGGLLTIFSRWVPFFSLFLAPGRLLYLVVIALAGLSGLVLTHLQGATSDERRDLLQPALRTWVPVALMLVFSGTFVLLALWSLSPPETTYWRLWHMANAAGETGLLLGAVGLTLWLWREDGPRAVEWATLATLVVVVIDLWRIGLPLITVDRVEPFHGVWHQVFASVPPHDPTFRVMTDQDPQQETLTANGAMATGYYNINAYASYDLESYVLFRQLSGDPTAINNRLWGVRYVVTEGPYEEQEGFDTAAQPALIAEGPYNIYEVDGGLRAFLPAEFEVVPDDDEARARLLADDFDPADTVILDRKPDCAVSGEGGTATFTEYTLNRSALDVQADGPGLLILTDQWYPGWTSSLDGQPAEILRADTLFRAVCVPAGEHTVTFHFKPTSVRWGMWISVAGWMALILVGLASVAGPLKPASMTTEPPPD